jgi:5'-3' exonuclease
MTPKEAEKFERFLDHIHHFEEIMRERTAVCCLAADMCEADDLVAGFVQKYGDDNKITIVSADQDFIQLLYNDNIDLIDPATGKSRRPLLIDDYYGDIEYFMFQKCLRGDAGDNVMSAFPRVRKTRIKKAYDNPYERANLLHEKWSDAENEYVVKELFEENQLLMDLRHQPDGVRDIITSTIESEMADPGRYSHFHFLKFLGEYELRKITESIDNFVPMLSR